MQRSVQAVRWSLDIYLGRCTDYSFVCNSCPTTLPALRQYLEAAISKCPGSGLPVLVPAFEPRKVTFLHDAVNSMYSLHAEMVAN